jgi:hypothetical protein
VTGGGDVLHAAWTGRDPSIPTRDSALAIFAASWHECPVWAAAVVAAMVSAAPADEGAHRYASEGIDGDAIEVGLRARVGAVVDEWAITVEAVGGQTYRVELLGPDGAMQTREVTLDGQTDEDRSRELASTIALLIESQPIEDPGVDEPPSSGETPVAASESTEEPAPEPQPAKSATGLLLLEGHVGLGPAPNLDADLGLGLAGGAWIVREHLQPRVAVRWSHSWAGDLRVHQFSGRLGLAAGAPLGRFWLGVLAMPAVEWTHAQQIRTASTWAVGGEASLLGQVRQGPVVVGLRAGIETTFTALRAIGTNDVIRWGHLRALLVVEIGLRL